MKTEGKQEVNPVNTVIAFFLLRFLGSFTHAPCPNQHLFPGAC
jgi:hypothetical protein